jgi:hypothetical protein
MAATLTRFTPAHWCLLIADLAIWAYVAQVAL